MLIASDPASVQSRYAEQATVDLEENRRQQRELTSRLEVLRQEEALLLDILSLAGGSTPPSLAEHVPQQARGSSALRPTAGRCPGPRSGNPGRRHRTAGPAGRPDDSPSWESCSWTS
ncbi:hypothetical protein [Streptomyces pseudogriseolus]|uniref:hypothetical protein n=1 Tax=Streptomyces pseudogriseolus TaxID=36817 RepID=UPI003FA1DA1F